MVLFQYKHNWNDSYYNWLFLWDNKQSINGVLLVLITGIIRAITGRAHRSKAWRLRGGRLDFQRRGRQVGAGGTGAKGAGAPSERQETRDSVGGVGGSCNFMLMMRRLSGLPMIDHKKGMIDTGFTTYSVS